MGGFRPGAAAVLGLLVGVAAGVPGALGADKPVFALEIREHRFVPESLEVPAGTRFVLLVRNRDATDEEFESFELNREVIVPAQGGAKIYLGPLEPGTYPFFGEFNKASAQGTLIAK